MRLSDKDLIRFISKFEIQSNGCWIWIGGLSNKNYGQFILKGRSRGSHRVSYEHFLDCEIKEGLVIDHLCRNKSCVNPLHLEEVTVNENSKRAGLKTNESKTHCKRGHEFTLENTLFVSPNKTNRCCKICNRAYHRQDYIKRKEYYKSRYAKKKAESF